MHQLRTMGLAYLALLLAACNSHPIKQLMPTPLLYSELGASPLDHVPEEQRWKPRRVYYATTRQRLDDLQRIDYTNAESDVLSVGLALIGFGGPNISWADLDRFSREASRDEEVDLTIAGVIEAGHYDPSSAEAHGAAAWLLSDLNDSIAAARDKDLLVYVHGAKVNFYNACAFAAQLDHFMGRDMTSLAFAWPTRQNIVAYGTGGDVRRAYRHAEALTGLLEGLAADSDARRIHIVAWSAGGRVVTEALSQLHQRHQESDESLRDRFRIGTVYLAAADVPRNEFLDALPGINALAQRVIVTASSEDGALKMSRRFMRGEARIGQVTGEDLTPEEDAILRAADRLEAINVSYGAEQRGFDITGHGYWFDHPWASSDLVMAIRSDFSAEERALQAGSHPALWILPEDYPERLVERLTQDDLQLRRSD